MSVLATGEPAVKKKQVRFARMENDDDNDDQDEDTLFDKRKDTKSGGKSVLKKSRKNDKSKFDDRVAIIDGGNSSVSGSCSRWIITVALCASFLGLGMGISVLGPTFGDLARNVNRNISSISYIFMGRAMGYIGGSVLAGFLFDFLNPHLLLGVSMLVTAFGMLLVPFCKKAILVAAIMSSVGISMGFLDTGGNVLILNTWVDRAGPHMQALHFSFAAGAFLSPIIAKLVFGDSSHASSNFSTDIKSPEAKTSELPPTTVGQTVLTSTLQFNHAKGSAVKSMWAYFVIGAFILLVSLVFYILYSRGTPSRDRVKASTGKGLVGRHHNALIILLFTFFFWYVGAEVAYGSFIFTYAKNFVHMDESEAAGLNSVFWGAFAATRGLAIFCATCMWPASMILLSLAGSTLSSLLLTLFSHQRVVLWCCSALYGSSMATIFPSGISWLEQYTTLTGRSAAVFVVGAALGEMVLPALVGYLLDRTPEHSVLMYLSLVTATITSILFPVMYKLATAPGTPSRKVRGVGRPGSDDSEYRRALLDAGANDDEEEEVEEEGEVDQWNDADFEVIEMDDASLTNSPSAVAVNSDSPPAVALNSDLSTESALPPPLADSTITLLADSPRKKQLVTLDREKRD